MEPISVFITTYNNQQTLGYCLDSVKWADEIVVVDSFSTDRTIHIASRFGAKVFQQKFLGYGPQKQHALEKTSNEWVLLLDADEAVSTELANEIKVVLRTSPEFHGYELPRQEQIFWRMCSRFTKFNYQLRLFRKSKGGLSNDAVHADPKVNGKVGKLKHPFLHFGEVNIHTKVSKINNYSSGMVEEKVTKGKKGSLAMCTLYPMWTFLHSYIIKRNFMNGSAGFIGSVVLSHYAFLKYAKVHEHHKFASLGHTMLPENAPVTLEQPMVPK